MEKKRVWKEEEWELYKRKWLPKFPSYTEEQLRNDFEAFWGRYMRANPYVEVVPEAWELVAELNK